MVDQQFGKNVDPGFAVLERVCTPVSHCCLESLRDAIPPL